MRRAGGNAAQPAPIEPERYEYFTTEEAAHYIRMSRQFLEGARYRGDGTGPPYIKLRRTVRYRRDALDAWMRSHDHASDKPI
jgi:hypothetical protein